MTSDNVNYLCIMAYNWRMVDFCYEVFSQKLFRIKFRFEWYIIWPYLTKFEFWPYSLGAHSGACPYMGIGGSEKIAFGYFSNSTCLPSIHAKFHLSITICRFHHLSNLNSIHVNSCITRDELSIYSGSWDLLKHLIIKLK